MREVFYILHQVVYDTGFYYVVYRMVSFGLEDFAKKYGALQPSQFVDFIALAGDQIDNIPGLLYACSFFTVENLLLYFEITASCPGAINFSFLSLYFIFFIIFKSDFQ